MRLIFLTCLCSLIADSVALNAQAARPRLAQNSSVHITAPEEAWNRREAVLVRQEGDTLVVARSAGSSVRLALASISHLEMQAPRAERIRSAVIGMGIGAGTGAALGYLLYRPYLDKKYLNDEWNTVAAITRGMVWGGALGGVLGYLLGGDRREHIPFGATAEVQPVSSGVAVGLRFPLPR